MSLPRIIIIFTIVLFGSIGIAALVKQKKAQTAQANEVVLGTEVREIAPPPPVISAIPEPVKAQKPKLLPEADRIAEFFNRTAPQFPIVQTITYKSRVTWLQGRPAWLSDYSSHFRTSRHFIARSLNGKADYLKQDIAEGDRFNILHPDKNIEFYLLVDVPRAKMWFYYIDLDTKQRVLVKSYDVGIGRADSASPSGYTTPLGNIPSAIAPPCLNPK